MAVEITLVGLVGRVFEVCFATFVGIAHMY